MNVRILSATAAMVCTLAAFGACTNTPLSYGDANSIIAVMPEAQWELIADDIYSALELRIESVRSEKAFTVTHQAPYAEFWDRLRRFRQMVIVGSASDEYVQEALDRAREPITENGVHQVYDVWSRGQTVTLILLDEGWQRADLMPYLSEVSAMLDVQYKGYARNRMYISGVDSALADTLSLQAGFSLLLPQVYRWQTRDSVFIFRNDNPDPSELIRQVAVTWRTPAVDELDRDEVLAWRADVVGTHYTEPQMVVLEPASERRFRENGNSVYELQAQWRNPPERTWPAGGPFYVRTVTCDNQDRTYLIDAWLYAPAKEKYEYMIQLETLLETFSCDS